MIRLAAVLLSALSVLWNGIALGQNDDCDRECLRNALMRYLNAVVDNAPDDAGIIVGFRQTENAEVKRVGTGTWQSVTALGEVQRRYLDPVSGQAAYFGLVEESGRPAMVSVRVKVVDRQITEAEWYIGREGQPGMAGDPAPDGSGAAPYDPANLIANPPPPERTVPLANRLSRESLLGVTNSYFDAITAHDPSIMMIHPDCRRIENGRLITGRPLPENSDDGYRGRTNCSSGIRSTGRLNIALVTARRYPVVDEQQQVVMGMAVFLRNPDSPNRRLGLSEFFHIDGELISEVYAAMFYAAPDQVVPNWPPYDGHFPLPAAAASRTPRAAEVEPLDVGLASSGSLITALHVAAGRRGAPTVALVAGLDGAAASSRAVRDELAAYAAAPDAERAFELVAIPAPNPERQNLVFPPEGAAYRESAESYVLWRWLGLTAPDLVLIAGSDGAGLATALAGMDVAGVAPIPARHVAAERGLLGAVSADLPPSAAHVEIERRRARTPRALANLLAPIYGQSFDPPIYIDGMGLIAQLELGHLEHVQALVEPYVDGTRDSLGGRFGVSSLVLAGHLVFAELAARTGDPRYLERARAAADLAFTDHGEMREAMPGHGEMSDSIFMGASILAAVGRLTGGRRYFDMAARHIAFMNDLVRRDDGLYRHSPLTDAAWGRGNGFAALGYALTLSALPADHPARDRLMSEYRALMTTLAGWQNADGTWRQVVDERGAYHETSATAIIGFSMQRGLNRGWLDPSAFGPLAERAFRAVAMRTDDNGGFIDVSESTNKQPSLQAYLEREALFGQDRRTGSFAMLFAVERAKAGGHPAND